MRTFRCEACQGEFVTEAPESVALAEIATNGWADIPMEDMARVCDECYQQIMLEEEP